MVAWYNTATLTKWFEPNEMRYDFYQAKHPWGPWTYLNSYSDRFIVGGHMYGPSLCAKFQERTGSEVRMSLFTSGCPFEDVPPGLYKMWEIPLVVKTTPVADSTLINDDDARIVYSGNWQSSTKRGFSDHNDDVHCTASAGDSLELTFTGTGIDYLAEKHGDLGNVDVYIDGVLKQNVGLRLDNFPRLCQIVVFSVGGLPAARHTIKIVSRSDAHAVVDAFRVYGSNA